MNYASGVTAGAASAAAIISFSSAVVAFSAAAGATAAERAFMPSAIASVITRAVHLEDW